MGEEGAGDSGMGGESAGHGDEGKGAEKLRNLGPRAEEPGHSSAKGPKIRGAECDDPRNGDVRIFPGMRIVLLGFSPRATNELKKLISGMGGVALSPSKYDTSTHLCLQGENDRTPQIITEEWIKNCCNQKKKDEVSEEIDASNLMSPANKTRSKQALSSGEDEEEIKKKLHQLFLCESDLSPNLQNLQNVIDQMKTMVHTIVTPGSSMDHKSTVTDDKVKLFVRKMYVIVKRLNDAGYSLGGNFRATKFVIDESKTALDMKLAFLKKGTLQISTPASKRLDMRTFEKIVRRELFKNDLPPHDINLWLSLLDDEALEDLLPSHAYIMSTSRCSESFSTWYDDFANLAQTRTGDYLKIIENLSEYNGWKKHLSGEDANGLLQETLQRCDPKTRLRMTYRDTVEDLLRLLRNSRQHSARYRHSDFALMWGSTSLIFWQTFKRSCSRLGASTSTSSESMKNVQ